MSIKKIITLLIFCFIISFLYTNSYSASETGGKEETALNIKIDTKDLSGINLWVAEMYNDDRLLYAIFVTLVMAALGSLMAFGTDLVLKSFGMSVTRISHKE
jgi:hypothetical protein